MREIIGRNLKRARELAGLSQEELAAKLDLSRATLSAIENGHVAIDSTKLLLSSRVLGRPVSDFFVEEEGSLAVLYRAAADVSAPSAVRADFERFCKAYRELEGIVGVSDSVLPPPEYSFSPSSHAKPLHFATLVAYSERERLGLGQLEPIENIFKTLEEQGVRIYRFRVEDDDVSGFSAYSRDLGLCMFVNENNTQERQIFSLAHEYGHLLMHRPFYETPKPEAGLDKEHELEKMADTFAANFLVPDVGLRDIFLKNVGEKIFGTEDLVFLKHYFRVSAEMMLRRLSDLKLISDERHETLSDEVKNRRSGPRKEMAPLAEDLGEAWKKSSRFEHLAKKAALSEMVSLGKLAELLGTSVVQARTRVLEWRKDIAVAQA